MKQNIDSSMFIFPVSEQNNNPKKLLHLGVIKGKKIRLNKVLRYKIIIHYSFSVHPCTYLLI